MVENTLTAWLITVHRLAASFAAERLNESHHSSIRAMLASSRRQVHGSVLIDRFRGDDPRAVELADCKARGHRRRQLRCSMHAASSVSMSHQTIHSRRQLSYYSGSVVHRQTSCRWKIQCRKPRQTSKVINGTVNEKYGKYIM